MQIAQFAKAVFNLSAICKMKKCQFFQKSTRTVINLCNLWLHNLPVFNLSAILKKCQISAFVPLSICVICANCTICKSCFQFECNLQNEEMSFQIYSLEDRTLINLCNLCKLHNLQKLFSICVAVFNMPAICKTKKCLFRSTRWRIVPLSICVICANCTICKSCFQFECNLQNEEMSFQIYSLEDRTLINLCNLCKLRNLQKLFSICVQSAKRRNVFSDLLVGGSYPYQFA